MLSLVNYGSSDEEDNTSNEEEEVKNTVTQQNGVNNDISDDEDSFLEKSTIKLPEPKSRQIATSSNIVEDDDEFLHKKEVPEVAPPPKVKQKVKITVPKLSDFKDDSDEDEDKSRKNQGPTAQNKKTGLLGMLPKPSHSLLPSTKPQVAKAPAPSSTVTSIQKPQQQQPVAAASQSQQEVKKKVGLIPYTLMDHSKKTDGNKKPGKRKGGKDSDDESDDDDAPFFSFDSKDDLPQVNEDEIRAMVDRETNRLELRKMQAEGSHHADQHADYSQYYEQQQQQQSSDFDQQAMKALVGGTKAKRSKLDNIQIVDISDQDVLPDRDEWKRKTLAGETSYIPTGQIDEKGPALSKRKHQITYLSMRAEKNIAELEAMWAANRQNNREGRSKYGF